MKLIPFLLLFSLSFCFKAVRSPFDTSTPSGAVMSYLSALKPLSESPAEEDVPVEIPNNRIRFIAKGNVLTYQIPNADKFTDFVFTPPPPPEITLDSQSGLITCSCLSNTPFFRYNFTLSYKSKATGNAFSTELFLEMYSPNVSIVISSGLFNASVNNKQRDPLPVVYNDKLYVAYNDTQDNKLKLARWNGTGVDNWEIVGSSSSSPSQVSIAVHNNKIYTLYYNWPNYYLDKYDENGYGSVEVNGFLAGTQYTNMTSHNNTLYMLFVDNSGSQTYLNSSATDLGYSSAFSSQKPAMISWNGDLYISYKSGTTLYIAKLVGSTWQTVASLNVGATIWETALTVFKNELYVGWRSEPSPTNIYLGKLNGTSITVLNSGSPLGDTVSHAGFHILGGAEKLYIAFVYNSPSFTIKYRSFDGTAFNPISNNLNVNWSCYDPQLVFWNDIPILFWREQDYAPFNVRIYAKVLD